ncbi:uncharacterized protein P174DRAFT_425182 [Aspergillus novofumigatus IBT 16806]|uniref:Uncharacterized protein n=1 Tax=Aspergillus novofumigatus (strain IBT 16806) TaxID=1392255 RepID=A0A2I1BVB5_ASPN1|nr:uncharacterized protein P174DRAFT_425182 [Aspergillus novofumigatus IBT 16806]PKX89251.1 hypothetical protein P174DRAFT_425182 [Aspergillus novofumigatus IBT 16806]
MSRLFNLTATPTKVDARKATRVAALAAISRTTLMVETILLAAVVLLLVLAVLYPRRLNFLRSDPGSIAAECRIIADLFLSDTVLARSDAQFHSVTTRQLRLWSKNFRCEWTGRPSERKINIVPLGRPLYSQVLALPTTRGGQDPGPHFLVPHWFLVECALLIGILVTFGLALSSLRVNDINDVTPRELTLTIFLIYGPTVVSSVISSLLASILRHLSVLEPWFPVRKSGTDGGLIRRSIAYLLPTADSPASPCQTSIFILARWATRNPAPMTSKNSLALYCTPSIQINEFEVLFDDQGTIASYKHAAATTDPRGQMLRNASESLGHFNRALKGNREEEEKRSLRAEEGSLQR